MATQLLMCVLILKSSHRFADRIEFRHLPVGSNLVLPALPCKMPLSGVKRMMFQPCTVLTSQWHRIPYSPTPRPGAQCLCQLIIWCLLLGNNSHRHLWLSLNLPGAAAALALALATAAFDERPNGRHHRHQRLRRRQRPRRRHPWICVLAPQAHPDD